MHNPSSRGFSLIELVVTVGILIALSGIALLGLARASAPVAESAQVFDRMLDQTRSLAAANAGSGSGALLVVTPTQSGSRLQVLRNRPLPGFDPPRGEAGEPPIDIAAAAVGQGTNTAFTIAVAPNGTLDYLPTALRPGAAALPSAPGCDGPESGRISVRFSAGSRVVTRTLVCDLVSGG